MFRACICLESGERLRADGVMREHTLYSEFHCEFRAGSHELTVAGFLEAADIAGVSAVELLVELLTGENCIIAVDDNDEFAAVNVGSKFGTMLTAKNVSGSSSGLTERLAGCVDDIPAAFNRFGLSHVCGHTVNPPIKTTINLKIFSNGEIIPLCGRFVNTFFEKIRLF